MGAELPRAEVPEDLRVYTIPEVARILQVGRHKVERLIRSGQLRAKLLGNSYRITHANLRAFLESDEAAPTAPLTRQSRAALRGHGYN